jgi:hypothetical protein
MKGGSQSFLGGAIVIARERSDEAIQTKRLR